VPAWVGGGRALAHWQAHGRLRVGAPIGRGQPRARADPAAGDWHHDGATVTAPASDSIPVMPRPYPARGKAPGVMRPHCSLASFCDGRPYAGVGVGPINNIAFRANAISTGVLRAASPPAELSLQRPLTARMGSDRSKIWHPHFSLHPIGSGGSRSRCRGADTMMPLDSSRAKQGLAQRGKGETSDEVCCHN
jgi:hypothetical protein